MPVHLRTITGKVEYEVEQVIRDLVFAVNRLETRPLPEAQVVPVAREEPQRAAVDRQAIGDLADDVGTVTEPPTIPGVAPPNQLALVVALDTVSPGLIADPEAFTQLIVVTLRDGGTIGSVTVTADPLWGRRRNDSGPLSRDTAAYLQENGVDNPYSIDIISGSTAPGATPQWFEVGRVGGTWEAA